MPTIAITADGKKIVKKVVTGPSSYSTGGFTQTIGELTKIEAVSVSIRTNLKTDNLVYAVDYSVSGNTITFTVYRIDVTAASPSAWSEVAAGTDISSLVIDVIVVGF